MTWLDNLQSIVSGQYPGLPIPSNQNIFGGQRGFSIGPLSVGSAAPTPAYAAPVQPTQGMSRLQLPASLMPAPAPGAGISAPTPPGTPLPRDATGDAVPAGKVPAYAAPALPGPSPLARPDGTMVPGFAGGFSVMSNDPVPANLPNAFGGGVRPNPDYVAPSPTSLGPVGLGAIAPPRSTAAVAATPAPSVPAVAAPSPVAAAPGGGGGFRFQGLSPITAQALAAFLPRQKMPVEQAQQTIADVAFKRYNDTMATLGAGASPAEYEALRARAMAVYTKDTEPLTVGPGMAQVIQSQMGAGLVPPNER